MKHTLVRKATIDDTPILLPLVNDYWMYEGIAGFESARVATQITRLLSEPRLGNGWIAFVEDVAVGYLLAVYVFSLEYMGLTAEIDEFFVLPPQRGQGIGVKMLRIAESEFVNAGCTNVSLQVSRSNNSARAFYYRNGYAQRSGYELLNKMLNDR